MDDCWERAVPFVALDQSAVSRMVRCCDPGMVVEDSTPVREGCRASVYCVHVTGGTRFLLKVLAAGNGSWEKEWQLRRLLQEEVPMPQLYGTGIDPVSGSSWALYEFVAGISLRKALNAGVRPGDELLEQLGRVAAAVHQHRYSTVGFLDAGLHVQQILPPVTAWYQLFLGPRARARLGPELVDAVEKAVGTGSRELLDLDQHPALVHGDFRPTNIMVDGRRLSGVVDWEFAMAGHPLSDIGQFFRYRKDFGTRERQAFERGYRDVSGMRLPPGWERTGRLRDLANLLQMMDAEGKRPLKEQDMKRLIGSIVSP